MRFAAPLISGTLLRRYKRFLADVEIEGGSIVAAHCPNPGSMLSVSEPGSQVWLSAASGSRRVLPYTWELIRIGDHLVGINTGRPNALVEEAIVAGTVPEVTGYDVVRREVRYGRNSRIDLLLQAAGHPDCFVEVKNVTMKRSGAAASTVEFPDSVTVRGTKHLRELTDQVQLGHRAVMLFVAQRGDGERLAIADDIDPAYAAALQAAQAAGVEVLCYRCQVTTDGVRLDRAIEVEGL